jgi:hypothetical protein
MASAIVAAARPLGDLLGDLLGEPLGEPLGAREAIAMALALSGVALAMRQRR